MFGRCRYLVIPSGVHQLTFARVAREKDVFVLDNIFRLISAGAESIKPPSSPGWTSPIRIQLPSAQAGRVIIGQS